MAALQPPHAQQIMYRDQQASKIGVFAAPRKPGAVADRDEADFPAFAPHQRDQEAVQVIEVWQFEKGVAPERFQAAAGIGGAIAEQPTAQPIAQARSGPTA